MIASFVELSTGDLVLKFPVEDVGSIPDLVVRILRGYGSAVGGFDGNVRFLDWDGVSRGGKNGRNSAGDDSGGEVGTATVRCCTHCGLGDGDVRSGGADGCRDGPGASDGEDQGSDCTSGGGVGYGAERGRGLTSSQRRRARKRARKASGQGGGSLCGGGESVPEWRKKPKERKPEAMAGPVQDDTLRDSLAAKWRAENELARLKAERALEVLKAKDIEHEKRVARAAAQRTLEKHMVAIERSHGFLKATGNVPGFPPTGFAESVVSTAAPDCTISPDSSASMAEFRAQQKLLLDKEAEVERLRAALEHVGLLPSDLDMIGKTTWTDTSENHDILDRLYPQGYGITGEYRNGDGKFSVVVTG